MDVTLEGEILTASEIASIWRVQADFTWYVAAGLKSTGKSSLRFWNDFELWSEPRPQEA